MALEKIDWDILNATADDWENLEQIYHMVCLEFSAENYETGGFYLRPIPDAPLLEEIADRIGHLFEASLLEGRLENGNTVSPGKVDANYMWRGWFRMTPQGRQIWESATTLADAAKKVVAAAK